MDIETYEDAVLAGLRKAGCTDAQIFNAHEKGIVLNTVVSHCFMKGREIQAVINSLARKLKGEEVA